MARKQVAKKDQDRLQELNDLRDVMNTGAGFRFVKRLLNITGPFQMRFNTDHSIHSFMDGQRNVGTRIVTDVLEACPEQLSRLLIESSKDEKEINDAKHKTDLEGDDETITD